MSSLAAPHLECHGYQTKYEKNDEGVVVDRAYVLKVTKTLSFSPAKVPKDFNEEWENVGGRLMVGPRAKEWDFDTRMHKRGQIQILDRLMYQGSNQFQGINPTAGRVSCTPVLVKKDARRKWARAHARG